MATTGRKTAVPVRTCQYVDSTGHRVHHAYADSRHRIEGRFVPLCATHAEMWKRAGIVATCSGPQRGRKPMPKRTWDWETTATRACTENGDHTDTTFGATR